MTKYERMRSTDLFALLPRLTGVDKDNVWNILYRRAHNTDNTTGAISNNGPRERRR